MASIQSGMTRPKGLFLVVLSGLCLVLSSSLSFGQVDLFWRMRVLRYEKPLAPKSFTAVDLEGKPVRLSDFRGNVVLLNFWATWCSPCKKEMGPLEALYRRFKGRGFVVLAVSLDQGGARIVRPFVEKKGLSFPILLDSTGKAKSTYHVTSLPATFLIDRKGRIIGRSLGPRDRASEAAVALVESLLVH